MSENPIHTGKQNVLRALPVEPGERKTYPIVTGVLDYFPLAIAQVAKVSKQGNDQHNPGQPLHWAREKSKDHADCIARHMIERGTIDVDGMLHTAKAAWRVLALLQEEMEQDAGYKPYAKPSIEKANATLRRLPGTDIRDLPATEVAPKRVIVPVGPGLFVDKQLPPTEDFRPQKQYAGPANQPRRGFGDNPSEWPL